MRQTADSIDEGLEQEPILTLHTFFPYQLRRTYAAVVACLGQICSEKFDLSGSEWRVLSILVSKKRITNQQIVNIATIDKVAVSRAIRKLEDRGLVTRLSNPDDGRSELLSPSRRGLTLFREIAPYMLDLEQRLLGSFCEAEKQQLVSMLKIVEQRAVDIHENNSEYKTSG